MEIELYFSPENSLLPFGTTPWEVYPRFKPLKDIIDPESMTEEVCDKLKGCSSLSDLYTEVKNIKNEEERLAWAGLITKAYLDVLASNLKNPEKELKKCVIVREVKTSVEGNEGLKSQVECKISTNYWEIKYGLDEAFYWAIEYGIIDDKNVFKGDLPSKENERNDARRESKGIIGTIKNFLNRYVGNWA